MTQTRITVGEVARPHGVGGTLKVNPLTDDVRRFEKLKSVIVDGKEYALPVSELLYTGKIHAEYEESVQLAERTFGDVAHYRDDLFWHNAYKVRQRQAVPEAAYTLRRSLTVPMEAGDNYRLRVWLRNGDCAWVSPIFCR